MTFQVHLVSFLVFIFSSLAITSFPFNVIYEQNRMRWSLLSEIPAYLWPYNYFTHFEHIFVYTKPFWCYVIQCVSSHSTKILIHITIYIWNYYGLWAFGLILRQNRGLWRCYIEEREKHTRFKSRTCVRITSRIYDSFKNEIRTGQKHKGNVSSSPKSKPNQMG